MTKAEFIIELDALKKRAEGVGMTTAEAIDAAADLALKYARTRSLTLAEVVDEAMAVAIECAGNKTAAARRLGIDRSSLYRWLDKKAAERDGEPKAES